MRAGVECGSSNENPLGGGEVMGMGDVHNPKLDPYDFILNESRKVLTKKLKRWW